MINLKFYTYKTFTENPNALTFESSGKIYDEITGLVEVADQDTKKLWQDFIKCSVIYSSTRSQWLLLSSEERAAVDRKRTRQHDEVIKALTKVAQRFEKQDLPTDWYNEISINPVPARKRFGDFACYVSYVYSVNAR